MFGKAVKIRHCPATVSATGELFVFFEGNSRESGQMPLGSLPRMRCLGRRFGKAQVRRPVLGATYLAYVPRGTEDIDVF
jgi:hypothetical protein